MSKVDGLIVPLMVVVSSVRLACNVLLCVLDEPYSKTYLIDFHHFHRAFFLLFVRQYVFLKKGLPVNITLFPQIIQRAYHIYQLLPASCN